MVDSDDIDKGFFQGFSPSTEEKFMAQPKGVGGTGTGPVLSPVVCWLGGYITVYI